MSTPLERLVEQALAAAYESLRGSKPREAFLEVRPCERPEFGDYASNIALLDAADNGLKPRDVAVDLCAVLCEQQKADPMTPFCNIEVAGPGFLNFFFAPHAFHGVLHGILAAGRDYGASDRGGNTKIQLEFVSSNPTGPLTVGHGRQAVLGDVLANLYQRLGYDVHREYYFNDEGRQIDLLAESLWAKHREFYGEVHKIPEDGYHGEYLKEIARELHAELAGDFAIAGFGDFTEEAKAFYRREAVSRMTTLIKEDLERLGVRFDTWFSEASLHRSGEVGAALDALREQGGVYEQDGAVWLKAEEHGGAKDSVLIRRDGRPTYLMVDIAYHINKRCRGFARVIDVQGADHHAEQSCVKAALRILDYPEDFLDYAVHQFVSLKEKGETLKMSTRAGRFVMLRDLLDELGKEIVRYFMISRKPEAHLDFDLDLARAESLDNPVTYIQYAHTRIASIFRKGSNILRTIDDVRAGWGDVDLSPLQQPEELAMIKRLDQFPALIHLAATSFAPHLLADYALQLSRSFHAYYDKVRVLGEDPAVSLARLGLLDALRTVLRSVLNLLGMPAPETM